MKFVAKDPRFLGILNDRDRERLYGIFLVEKEKKERAKAAKKHDEAAGVYTKILRVCCYIYRDLILLQANVTLDTIWADFYPKVRQVPAIKELGDLECLHIYTQHIASLEDKEKETTDLRRKYAEKRARRARMEFRVRVSFSIPPSDAAIGSYRII